MSLLGYFLIFNGLNILDGLLTLTGIEMGLFYEANPGVIFLMDKFGLYPGIYVAKITAFFISIVLHLLGRFEPNWVKGVYWCLIAVYGINDLRMAGIIFFREL